MAIHSGEVYMPPRKHTMNNINTLTQSLPNNYYKHEGLIVFLTGAGISAESGVPTFRGQEGYWTIGSVNHHPQELATWSAFTAMPYEVWAWYLYRRSICQQALPNAAHKALVRAEQQLRDRFLLITQNVDGLHLQAGNTHRHTYQIHGNLNYRRCVDECGYGITLLPDEFDVSWSKQRRLLEREHELVNCPGCGSLTRPHVLWFDEYYDEDSYRFESSIKAANEAALLIVIGTSGSTNLPRQVCDLVMRRNVPTIVIDPENSAISQLTEQYQHGVFIKGTAVEVVPDLVDWLIESDHGRSA
ncbi:NAD-dependent deacetylase [Pseudomonadota bacterium]